MDRVRHCVDRLNSYVGASTFGRIFRLEGCGHDQEIRYTKFTTELRAGLTTFFTMSYIIAVNASILADSGGDCVCNDTTGSDPFCLQNAEYAICKQELNRSLVTATAAIAGFSSFLFGFLTNMPVALAPGMGLNAYFAYQIVGFNGEGIISYNLALTAVFIEGFVFVALSLLGMRQWLVKVIPVSLKIAAACGIGLFLALIGLGSSEGIGAVTGGKATPLQIAGCPDKYIKDGVCVSHKMTSPTMWLGVMAGGIVTAYLMSYKVKSAMIVGILLVSIISWPRGTSVTYFPHTEMGDSNFNFFKKVVDFQPIKQLNVLDWNITQDPGNFAIALFTFLYVDIIDCTATLYSMARFSGVVDPDSGDFPRSTLAYCTDAFCISIGALLGTSPVTAFIESGAGIAEGGKTGLTAMTCGVCFLISMFFAPLFASIPPWATGCTLILVGCLMMRQITNINWSYIGDAIPAFVTVMFIPFGYSVAYGLIAGLMVYTALNGMIYITKLVSGGRIVPDDEDHREYWTIKPHGKAPWFFTASQALADQVRGRRTKHTHDVAASRIADNDGWEYQDRLGSKGSTHEAELERVVVQALPTNPSGEKVLRRDIMR
ncbi:permease family-domain-containing protein [Paraphoma chrysanthemicola]|uniref:Permease family-domain-containing protein n=1 Tax=Paraphoma chrysanthemicola TaxID=798071 RepID=A0A8K0RLA0_9PLEO|nr:permease family-domain-containing protein [Paraphoma chrysanthemicola]